MIKIPNSSNLRVIVEGIARASIVTMYTDGDHFNAVVDRAPIYDVEVSAENTAYIRTVKRIRSLCFNFQKISNEVVAKIICCEDIAELTDYICENSFSHFRTSRQCLKNLIRKRE